MKKYIIYFLVLVVIGSIGTIAYAIKTFSISELVICASSKEAFYIPEAICEYYLMNYRGNKKDVQELENGGGLGFIANIEDTKKRYEIMDYFISKGIDINRVNEIDGLTPLHSAISLNDPKLVQYLLSKGADPLRKDKNSNSTAYEYVDYLSSIDVKNSVNRDSVRKILREFYHKPHNH